MTDPTYYTAVYGDTPLPIARGLATAYAASCFLADLYSSGFIGSETLEDSIYFVLDNGMSREHLTCLHTMVLRASATHEGSGAAVPVRLVSAVRRELEDLGERQLDEESNERSEVSANLSPDNMQTC